MEPKRMCFYCTVIVLLPYATHGIRINNKYLISTMVPHDEKFQECDYTRPNGLKLRPERSWSKLSLSAPHNEWALYPLIPGVRVIVEIGGNRGDDITQFLQQHKQASVFTFEPTPYYFDVLKRTFGDNQRVNISNVGASDSSGEAEFIMDGMGTSGLDSGIHGEHVQVHLSDVDDILTGVSQKMGYPPDVLSMNCEGCEYAVMQRIIDRGWLGKIRFIQLSWHTPAGVMDRVAKRCNIEKALWQSYDRIYSAEYGWVGWQLREKQ